LIAGVAGLDDSYFVDGWGKSTPKLALRTLMVRRWQLDPRYLEATIKRLTTNKLNE
jgi:hypothetical protein